MEKRRLGKSELYVAPLCLGGNVFGWTADETTSFRLLDAFVDAGFNFIDTADVYSRWAPGNQGGESETIIGKWLKRARQARRRRDRDQGRHRRWGRASKGLSHGLHRARGGGLAAPAADRSHRPLPVARRRSGDAARGDAGGLWRTDRGRQGAGDRRLQLHAPRGWPRRWRRAQDGLPRYESLQPEYNLMRRAASRRELEPLCRSESSASFRTSAPRARLPNRQVPQRSGPRQERARRAVSRAISTSAASRMLAALDAVAADACARRRRSRSPG